MLGAVLFHTLVWIQDVIRGGGHVFVHCVEGVSRSSSIVIAYLMWQQRTSFEEALKAVRAIRPTVSPNPGFSFQLMALEKRWGLAGEASPPPEETFVGRVGIHHPKRPVLVVHPVEFSSKQPLQLDPRFVYLVQRGSTAVLWQGSRCPVGRESMMAVDAHITCQERVEGHAFRRSRVAAGDNAELALLLDAIPPVVEQTALDSDAAALVETREWDPVSPRRLPGAPPRPPAGPSSPRPAAEAPPRPRPEGRARPPASRAPHVKLDSLHQETCPTKGPALPELTAPLSARRAPADRRKGRPPGDVRVTTELPAVRSGATSQEEVPGTSP